MSADKQKVCEWQQFSPLTDKKSVSGSNIVHWQTKSLSVHENDVPDRQNVCQTTNYIHWQTKCLSSLHKKLYWQTKCLSVNYKSYKNLAIDIQKVCQRSKKAAQGGWRILLLTYILSVSDTEKPKKSRKKPKNQWLTDFCLSVQRLPQAFCLHWQTFCLSINDFSSVTDFLSVNSRQKEKARGRRLLEQRPLDLRNHLNGDIHI
mgnify:CR=1 FL=1